MDLECNKSEHLLPEVSLICGNTPSDSSLRKMNISKYREAHQNRFLCPSLPLNKLSEIHHEEPYQHHLDWRDSLASHTWHNKTPKEEVSMNEIRSCTRSSWVLRKERSIMNRHCHAYQAIEENLTHSNRSLKVSPVFVFLTWITFQSDPDWCTA